MLRWLAFLMTGPFTETGQFEGVAGADDAEGWKLRCEEREMVDFRNEVLSVIL